MSKKVMVFVGTNKGGFIFSSDAKRKQWQTRDIHFKSWNVMHMQLDPPDQRLHAATSHLVYGPTSHYSDDFGKTWTQAKQAPVLTRSSESGRPASTVDEVLKGAFKAGRLAALPRKVLVVLQFTVSVALIIGTIIVYQQIQYSKNRPVGYNRNGLIIIPMTTPEFYGKHDVLSTELKARGAITEMAESNSPLTAIWNNSGDYSWEGKDPNLDVDFAVVWVTPDYGKTVGFELKEGRDYSKDFPGDSSSIVINESAAKFMNIKDPVGKIITDLRLELRDPDIVPGAAGRLTRQGGQFRLFTQQALVSLVDQGRRCALPGATLAQAVSSTLIALSGS